MSRICRRRFVLAAVALLIMRPAVAQQAGRIYRVGVLFDGGSSTWGPYRETLRERLAPQGFVEGRNLHTIWRGGTGYRHEDREAARALVAARPDAILAFSSPMRFSRSLARRERHRCFNPESPAAGQTLRAAARVAARGQAHRICQATVQRSGRDGFRGVGARYSCAPRLRADR